MDPASLTLSWDRFPLELKHQIFRVLGDAQDVSFLVRMNYILVCKEWQHWFEVDHFEHLVINAATVTLHELVQFSHLSPRRQLAVKKISLRVCLQTFEVDSKSSERGLKLTFVIITVLGFIRRWTRAPHQAGLELEMHVKSILPAADCSALIDLDIMMEAALEVPIVKTFTLRGEYRLCVRYAVLKFLLENTFPKLEQLAMEKDLAGRDLRDDQREDDFPADLVRSFPATLKSWTFISTTPSNYGESQDGERLVFGFSNMSINDWLVSQGVNLDILHLGDVSARLECIVLLETVDADRFLLSSRRTTWPKLKTLSLSSMRIRDTDITHRWGVLVSAAKAVQNMPQIQHFEIWGLCPLGVMAASLKYTRTSSFTPGQPGDDSRTARAVVAVTKSTNDAVLTAENMWYEQVETAWNRFVAHVHECRIQVEFENKLGVVSLGDEDYEAKTRGFLIASGLMHEAFNLGNTPGFGNWI